MKHTIGKFYTTDKPSDIGRVYASDGELVATVHQTKDKCIYQNTRLFTAAPIGAELAEAVLAFADPQNMGFKEPPLPRFNLDQWWRIVALAREFQKAKEE